MRQKYVQLTTDGEFAEATASTDRTVRCTNCDEMNPADAQFCMHCGKTLPVLKKSKLRSAISDNSGVSKRALTWLLFFPLCSIGVVVFTASRGDPFILVLSATLISGVAAIVKTIWSWS